MLETKLLNLVALEQFFRGRAIAVIFNDAELPAVSDNLEENFLVFRILAPAARLGGPDHTIALDPASIIPDEIVDRPDVAQEQDVPVDSRYMHDLGIATRDRCNRGPANRFGRKRGCGDRRLWRKASGQN